MAERYRTGVTVRQLSEEFGVSRETVSQRLKQAGVTLRRQPPTETQVDEMVRLYQQGLSLVQVGAQVGYGGTTVYRKLTERCVPLRDKQGRGR